MSHSAGKAPVPKATQTRFIECEVFFGCVDREVRVEMVDLGEVEARVCNTIKIH